MRQRQALLPLVALRAVATTVVLASYPRSGNHWVRWLIEEATGVATLSQYNDTQYDGLAPVQLAVGDVFAHAFAPPRGYSGTRRLPTGDAPVIVKSHLPKEYGGAALAGGAAPLARAHAVVLHRFPLDAIASLVRYRHPEVFAGRRRAAGALAFAPAELAQVARNWSSWHAAWRRSHPPPASAWLALDSLLDAPADALARVLRAAGFAPCAGASAGAACFGAADVARAIERHPPEREAGARASVRQGFWSCEHARVLASALLDTDGTESEAAKLGYAPLLQDLADARCDGLSSVDPT